MINLGKDNKDTELSNYDGMSCVMGIDQSLACTGWVILEPSQALRDFGCIKTTKDDGGLYIRAKFMAERLTAARCRNVFEGESPMILLREGLGFGGSNSNATRDLAYLVGMIEGDMSKPLYEIAPTALKKFATGSGKAKKEDMIAALPEDVLDKFSSEGYKKTTGLADLADAYWLARAMLSLTMKEV